jgi:hypothetical protein
LRFGRVVGRLSPGPCCDVTGLIGDTRSDIQGIEV